jgi:hypothetical protein
MKITIRGVNPKFGGRCLVCGKQVESNRLWDAVLGDTPAGKALPFHLSCVGGRYRGMRKSYSGPDSVEVS